MTSKPNPRICADLLLRLNGLTQPAWLVDVPQSRIVWANQAGRSALGPGPETAAADGYLDQSMPAMQRIVTIHDQTMKRATKGVDGAAGPIETIQTVAPDRNCSSAHHGPHLLEFWTAGGTRRHSCMIETLAPPARDLVLVTAQAIDVATGKIMPLPIRQSVARGRRDRTTLYANLQNASLQGAGGHVPSRAHSPHLHTPDAEPGAAPGTDAATLQEIARRIRQAPTNPGTGPFSLDALHAAANGKTNKNSEDAPIATPLYSSIPHERPRRIDFAQAARAHARNGQAVHDNMAQMPEPAQDNQQPKAQTIDLETSCDTSTAPAGDTAKTTIEPLAKLAHELRTPISAIHAAAEIMAHEQLGPIGSARYKDYAADMQQSAAHALGVIEAMLEPAYLKSGQLRARPDRLDLTRLVAGLVSSIKPLAEAAHIELRRKLDQPCPPVRADPRMVRQMLLNLLTNALKFTPAGGQIKVTIGRDNNDAARIEITDTGPGMTSAAIAAIMSPSAAQRNNAGQDAITEPQANAPPALAEGLGLGLPLVKALARANGAKLVLSSGEGESWGLCAAIIFPKQRLLDKWPG